MTARDWFERAREEGFALRFHSGQNFPKGDWGKCL